MFRLLAIIGFVSAGLAKSPGGLLHHEAKDKDLDHALQGIQHLTFSKAEPINKTAPTPQALGATGGPTYAATYAVDMLACWDANGDNYLSSAEIECMVGGQTKGVACSTSTTTTFLT